MVMPAFILSGMSGWLEITSRSANDGSADEVNNKSAAMAAAPASANLFFPLACRVTACRACGDGTTARLGRAKPGAGPTKALALPTKMAKAKTTPWKPLIIVEG